MENNSLTFIGVISIIVAIVFVTVFPSINEFIVEDQVETHTATVLTCDQEYRLSLLGSKSEGHRYIFTVTATLEDGTEIIATEINSYMQQKYTSGQKITVYGLKGKYKLERDDLFAPWVGNSEILYITVLIVGGIPILIGTLLRKR